MSKLEDIVPPLEDCKKIPPGAFADSVLVWTRDVGKSEFYVAIREDVEFCRLGMINAPPFFPAQTLAEILKKLNDETRDFDDFVTCRAMDDGFWKLSNGIDGEIASNPATAALRLWLRINAE